MSPGPIKRRWFRSLASIAVVASKWLLVMTVIVVVLSVAAWVWILEPRVDRYHKQGVDHYEKNEFPEAIAALQRVYPWNRSDGRLNLMLGQSYWRTGQPELAQQHFSRAYEADTSSEPAKLGLALSSLATQRSQVALPLFQDLAARHPDDREIRMSLARAYLEMGQNYQAARAWRDYLGRHPADDAMRRELLGLYGFPEGATDFPLALVPAPRPERPQLLFRTFGEYFQVGSGADWKTVYITGVNIGPARPGEYPSTASRDFSVYSEWLSQIAAMNANTVRVYTILPPAFYQAFKAHNETASSPLWLIQEIWLDESVENLYEPDVEREFSQEVRNAIDLLHGQANIRYRRGHHYGIYTADVSRWVLGLGVGREVEAKLVQLTNRNNPSHTSYRGRFVSLPSGHPTEAWFARMCDFAAAYEMDRYHAQRPLTVVNWPPLDPLSHPSEASYVEELQTRRKRGETGTEVVAPDAIFNDADIVELDIRKFRVEPDFQAGLFALFHVYQHWPDFMFNEERFALASDSQGPNRYLGYLRELKEAHSGMPLFIGEYGVASSLGVAHIHPQGWHNGGLTEKQQAELLVRFTRNIFETGCAGGLVFAWQDEWFKHVADLDTAPFEQPWDRNPLWFNPVDPEKNFGVVGWEPVGPVPLLRGEPADWVRAEPLYYQAGRPVEGPPGELVAVYAYSDFAYLYLRIDVEPAAVDWNRWNFWIALNTLPGEAGSRMLPDVGVRLASGANFLIELSGPSSSRMLIAQNYNPNHRVPLPGRPDELRVLHKDGMTVQLNAFAPFEERITEANPPRYGRDGKIYPAQDYNRSGLPYGTADRRDPQYNSHALWHADAKKGMIELRVPWGRLLVMDPSSKRVFAGTGDRHAVPLWIPLSRETRGVTVSVYAIFRDHSGPEERKIVSSSLPPLSKEKTVNDEPLYAWSHWDQVDVRPYFKPSYFALQQLFGEITRSFRPPAAAALRRAGPRG